MAHILLFACQLPITVHLCFLRRLGHVVGTSVHKCAILESLGIPLNMPHNTPLYYPLGGVWTISQMRWLEYPLEVTDSAATDGAWSTSVGLPK